MLKLAKISLLGGALIALTPYPATAQFFGPIVRCQSSGGHFVNGKCEMPAQPGAPQPPETPNQQGGAAQTGGGPRAGAPQGRGQQGAVQQENTQQEPGRGRGQGSQGNVQGNVQQGNAQPGGGRGPGQQQGSLQQASPQQGAGQPQGNGRIDRQVRQDGAQQGNVQQGNGQPGGGRGQGQQQGSLQQPNPTQGSGPGNGRIDRQGQQQGPAQGNDSNVQQNNGQYGNNNNGNQGQRGYGQYNNDGNNNFGQRDNSQYGRDRTTSIRRNFDQNEFNHRYYGRYGYDPNNFERNRQNYRAQQQWRERYPHDYVYADDSFYRDCQTNNEVGGAIVGAILGGLLGNSASTGQRGATLAGVIIGGVGGASLARNLDCEDRSYVYQTYYDGFESGRRQANYQWRNDRTGHYGTLLVDDYYRDQDNYRCATYTQTIYVRGTPQIGRGHACRQEDGTWAFVD